jgi:hypothetical protein
MSAALLDKRELVTLSFCSTTSYGFAWFSAGAADATVASSAATSLQICSFISTKYLKMNTKTIKKQRKIMTVKKGSKISHLRKNEK